MYKAQTYLFNWSSLQCDVNRSKLPGDSLKSNCSGKMTKEVASATDVDPFPYSSFPEHETWNEVLRDRIEQGELLSCNCMD